MRSERIHSHYQISYALVCVSEDLALYRKLTCKPVYFKPKLLTAPLMCLDFFWTHLPIYIYSTIALSTNKISKISMICADLTQKTTHDVRLTTDFINLRIEGLSANHHQSLSLRLQTVTQRLQVLGV